VVSYFSDLWCKGHLKFNKFAKKLILIVRLLCSMQGDDEIWGWGGGGGVTKPSILVVN